MQAPEEDVLVTQADTLSVPVQARIAIVMYIKVGDASPELVIQEIRLDDRNGQAEPVFYVRNRGNAHARTAGFVDATDANGRRLEFAVAALPILPGQTRRIPLRRAYPEDTETEAFTSPLDLQGTLEWETGTQKITAHLK